MMITTSGTQLSTPLPPLAMAQTALDPKPEPVDVTPGWEHSFVVLSLILLTVVLSRSMIRRVRRVQTPIDRGREATDVSRPAE